MLTLTPVSNAQIKSTLSMKFDKLTTSNLSDPIPGIPNSEQADWEISTGEGELTFPLFAQYVSYGDVLVPTRAFINTFKYRNKKIRENLSGFSNETYSSVNFTTFFFNKLSNKWYVNLIGGFGLAADDIGQAENSDITYQAGGYFDWHSSNGWTLGFGAIFSQFSGDSHVLPLVHIAKKLGKSKFELLVPKVTFETNINKYSIIGIIGEMQGDLYTLTNSSATLFDTQGNIVQDSVGIDLAFSEVKVGPYYRFKFPNSNFTFEFVAGVSLARRFEILANDEETTLLFPPGGEGAGEKLDFDLKPAGFFTTNIKLSF